MSDASIPSRFTVDHDDPDRFRIRCPDCGQSSIRQGPRPGRAERICGSCNRLMGVTPLSRARSRDDRDGEQRVMTDGGQPVEEDDDQEPDGPSLKLLAEGPATMTREQEPGRMTVTEAFETDLSAEFEIGAEWVDEHGTIGRNGVALRERDVAALVAERLSGGGREYHVNGEHREEWQVRLAGRVDEWLNLAVALADRARLTPSDEQKARSALYALEDLGEHADERPTLAMLDLLGTHEVDDYDRDQLLAELGDVEAHPKAPAQPARADGGEQR